MKSLKSLFAGLVIALGLGTLEAAHAAPGAAVNQAWGEFTKQFAHTGTLGQHASHPPGVEPGEGREGVGNISKEFAPLSEGGQGQHACAVGQQLGFSDPICDQFDQLPP